MELKSGLLPAGLSRGCEIKLQSFFPEFIDTKLPNFQYKEFF